MDYHKIFTSKIPDFDKEGTTLLKKSRQIIISSQSMNGATSASLKGTRYAGFCYPRDHGYTTRAFIALGEKKRALKALQFILSCPLSNDGVMSQRYDMHSKNASYKPPQIDGNAQTLISVMRFIKQYGITEEVRKNLNKVKLLINGILSQKHDFKHGSLIYSLNGIIEYSPFESGFELYTNAVCYRALLDSSLYPELLGNQLSKDTENAAISIKNGISYYLFFDQEKTFITCLRPEPDVSIVRLANLKSYLALSDFEVFGTSDKRVSIGISYHLQGTYNKYLEGYNRYHDLIDRHNFGNGPWPMVMLRLAQFYNKTQQKKKALECFTWVLNAAKFNRDKPLCLPEHIATKKSFDNEYKLFKKLQETAPRPAKEKEYMEIRRSKIMKEMQLAYAVNPLVWSHAQFILAWNELTAGTPFRNY